LRVFLRCADCAAFTPKWYEVGKKLRSIETIQIAELDCAFYSKICKKFQVKSYPSYLLFNNGSIEERFTGEISVRDLVKYVRAIDSDSGRVKREASETLLELTDIDFNSTISTGTTALVVFYAPFCKYTANLLEIFHKLSDYFINNSNITIAKVDCTKEINKEICFYEVQNGVPTVNLYNGTRIIDDYNGLTYVELKDLLFSHSHPNGKKKNLIKLFAMTIFNHLKFQSLMDGDVAKKGGK
jgi:thioredoxin domain-containing protein 5